MHDSILPQAERASLAPALLDTLARVRALHADVDLAREMLSVAVSVIAERDRDVARVRAENVHLRAQLRAAFSGKTIAEERQQAEQDALDAWKAAA